MHSTNKAILGFFILCLFCLTVPFVKAQETKKEVVTRPEYKVGQMWSYHSRPGEERSYLVIVKIENEATLGTIIHVALNGLKIKNPHTRSGFTENVNHLPFSKDAICKSVTKVLKEKVDLPGFEEGYRLWRDAFDDKRAGIYTISVAEAAGLVESSLNQ